MIPGRTVPEFDRYASSYTALLRDPIRERFAGDPAFFHARKWALIRDFLTSQCLHPSTLRWLDIGCGDGALLNLAGHYFASATGCDPSLEMIHSSAAAQVYHQPSESELPFAGDSFDLVTAVCVYHHVEPCRRASLSAAIRRVLKPGGLFCLIEHNPCNPVTRLIVKRCPVDRNAILLRTSDALQELHWAGLDALETAHFLFFPDWLFPRMSRVEHWLKGLPLGGQFAVFGRKP